MSAEHELFLLRTEQLLEKIVTGIKNGGGGVGGGVFIPPHVITQEINSKASYSFDSKNLFPTEDNYDLLSTKVEVMLLDSDPGSSTGGFYINPEASLTWGINETGIIHIHNYHPDKVTVRVSVYQPSVRKNGGWRITASSPYVITQEIDSEDTYILDSRTLHSKPEEYELLSTRAEVLLLDNDTESPTHGYYINPEASVTWGVNTDGILRVHNYRPEKVTVRISVFMPLIKLTP